MKLDTNKAWTEATALVRANADVLWALAGVFFVLPTFAFSVIYPDPQIAPSATPEQILAAWQAVYANAWPLIIIVFVMQMLGSLAIYSLFSDHSRPTVGQAIGLGAAGMPSFIGAQLLVLITGIFAGIFVSVIAALTGLAVVKVILFAAMLIALIYFGVRLGLIAPVIAVEGQRNPLTVLNRSWTLTEGNVGRILLFYALLAIAFIIVIGLVLLVIGMILAVLVGGEIARVIAAFFSAALSAAAQLYFVGVTAAIHRQLSGRTVATQADTFS